jgi:hypothetical protein
MSTAAASTTKSVKKVATKAAAPATTAPATVTPAPAAAAAPAKEKKVKAVVPEVAAAPATAPATEVVAPEASAVAAPAEVVPAVSSASQIDSLIAEVSAVRDAAAKTLKSLQALKKNVAREVKEAGRRRRRNRKTSESSDGSVAPKRPNIFTTPVGLKDELASFLGKAKGTKMTPAEVNHTITAYVKAHGLKDKGHVIRADAAMRKCLGLKEGDELTYRNIQKYLYKLYVLPEKKAATTA